MKAKNFCLIVFAIILISAFFSGCGMIGKDPNSPDDTTPHPKSVLVKYVRVQPIPYPEGIIPPTVVWDYGTYQGGNQALSETGDENTLTTYIQISTETKVTLYINDIKEYNGSNYQVAKYVYIDGIELVVSYTYGSVSFIYHNDGTIKVVP